jgi:hypothetical protein
MAISSLYDYLFVSDDIRPKKEIKLISNDAENMDMANIGAR